MNTSHTPGSHNLEISGQSVIIRPIRITDADMEAEFVRRLSPESRHFRFLGGARELPPTLLKKFFGVDGYHSMAFVATVEEDGKEVEIGIGRFAPNAEEDVQEMDVTVADGWQKKGVGTILANQLIGFAKDHGIRQLYSVDLADNSAMQHLADDLGMEAHLDSKDMHQVIYSMAL